MARPDRAVFRLRDRGAAHVHWHGAPLSPGVPYGEQQFPALMLENKGTLEIPEAEKTDLAARIRRRIEGPEKATSGRSTERLHPKEDE